MSKVFEQKTIIVFLALFYSILEAQTTGTEVNFLGRILTGELVVKASERTLRIDTDEIKHKLFYTKKHCLVESVSKLYGTDRDNVYADGEVEIISADFKSNDPEILFILFSDGSVTVYRYDYENNTWRDIHTFKMKISKEYPYFRKIAGDAIYIHEGGDIYASRDTAKTWSIDTTGLNGSYVSDVSVDTNNYGWVATTKGAFYQHPDSNIWHKSSSSPLNCQAIFIDRKNRIFVSTFGSVFVSTNYGTTWESVSDGMSGLATSFGDDKFGNIYATTNTEAYRLSNLTPPWVKISDSIASLGAIQSNNGLVKSISGDSVIYAATKYGLLESIDQGTLWKYSATQFPAFQFYGLVRSKNYYLTSTNLGVYRLKDGDSTFTKVYPVKGFLGELKIRSDSAGNVYAVVPVKISEFNTKVMNFKSTDNGTTWVADTAGMGSDPFLNFYGIGILYEVDAQGNQYTFRNGGGLFSKTPGGVWKLDTNGLNFGFSGNISSVSTRNKKGIVYAVKDIGFLKFALYKRALTGTTWQEVDITAVGQTTVKIVSDHNGDIILTTWEGKIFRCNGTSWTEIPKPTGVGGFPLADQFIVDKNGVLWVAFIDGFSYLPHSVRFTEDNGTTWKKAAIDSVGINFFATSGDSIFAVSWIDGIYTLTTASVVHVHDATQSNPMNYELYQNYPNPFNPNTVIGYQLPAASRISLKVYDAIGREVAVLVNELKEAGNYSVKFNASKLSTGLYIYRMTAGNYSASKKLLLIR